MQLIKIYSLSVVLICLTSCGGRKAALLNLYDKEYTGEIMAYKEGYSIANIINCGQAITPNAKTFCLFADYDGRIQDQDLFSMKISGWNHTINGNIAEWQNVKLAGDDYNLSHPAKVNNSCSSISTLDVVLLKKVADWNHQHSNGLEFAIPAGQHKFGDIKNLVFDIKINSARTEIPSIENIKKTYTDYVNESIVEALDDGKVNIGITLAGDTNLNASIIVQLDQTVLSDKWVRITIPMDKLSYYQEINYKKTTKTQADLTNVEIKRMLIVGETKSGAVLRKNITSWNANIPETFKEMDVSFKKIEFQLK